MTLADIIAIAVIVLIVGGACAYIIKAKKSGKKCIGCPDGCSCGTNTNANSGEENSCSFCSACCANKNETSDIDNK